MPTMTQLLIEYTQEKIEKILEEGHVVTTDTVAIKKVNGLYKLWAYSKERWIDCTWLDPLQTVAVVAATNGYVQFTSDEFSVIRYKL